MECEGVRRVVGLLLRGSVRAWLAPGAWSLVGDGIWRRGRQALLAPTEAKNPHNGSGGSVPAVPPALCDGP